MVDDEDKRKDWDVWFHDPRQDKKTNEFKDDNTTTTLQTSKTKTKKAPVEKSTINLVTTNATPSSSQRPPSNKPPAGERNDKPMPPRFVCAAERHKIEDCTVFTSMIPNKRAETIFSNNRCMTCLFGLNHTSKDCRKKKFVEESAPQLDVKNRKAIQPCFMVRLSISRNSSKTRRRIKATQRQRHRQLWKVRRK